MSALTDFIVNFGDVVELDFPALHCFKVTEILNKHPGWKIYQPHKPGYNRFGLSVTSLDGGYSGKPDLYSLREYYKNFGESYQEIDFKKRTSIVEFIPELNEIMDYFEPGTGRCHFLRLDKGGFFPPHRDNGAGVDVPTFRILIPINNFNSNDMKWIQEDSILNLRMGTAYFINTTRLHSVFSFVDNCLMFVMNIQQSPAIMQKLVKRVAAL
jgi:hypothetical protein